MDLIVRVLIGFLVAALCTPAGVSGAFLLLPVQIQVLGVPSPSVTATNLVFNVVATPAGIVTYERRGRLDRELLRPLLVGAVTGMVAGVVLRTTVLASANRFAWPAGTILVVLGARLLWESAPGRRAAPARTTLPPLTRLVVVGLVAGTVGGIYGLGGAALAVPWLVGVERLPVVRVAGAALVVTFATSLVGVATFVAGSALSIGTSGRPNWAEGLALGVGGAVGAVVGARLQPRVPVAALRALLGVAATAAGLRMLP